MKNNNIHIYNGHKIEEYKQKYSNNNLNTISVLEANENPELLNNKTWWKIDDTYYEVPSSKNHFINWWKNITKKKKIIISSLCVGLVATAIVTPIVITSINTTKVTECEYKFNPDEEYYYVSGVKDKTATSCNILDKYNNYPVVSINKFAFAGCTSLLSISIPNSITTIGFGAFINCVKLKRMTIPFVGESNESNAFLGYIFGSTSPSHQKHFIPASLKEIILSNGCTSISDFAFYDCSSITSIALPTSITSIGQLSFGVCTSIASITIPNSVKSLDDYAFASCRSLTSITIPSSITSISERSFFGCTSISSMVVDANNLIYDSRNNSNAIIEKATNTLIVGCKNTIIPNSVTSIGDYSFAGCGSLTSITIPNSVKSIGNDAFESCSSLASITIPNSVVTIGNYAFYDCPFLSSIIVDANNLTYDSRNNSNAIIEKATNTLILGCKNTIIPDSVLSIGESSFTNCTFLASINIPSSVTSICLSAFLSCVSLTSIYIPNSVTSIEKWAFMGCVSLTIYCEAQEKPSGWNEKWNPDNCPVEWGYKF